MRREVEKLKMNIFEEIHQLSEHWNRLYTPPKDMGVSFDRYKQKFAETPHPPLALSSCKSCSSLT
jgi:hypothetical protein